MFDFNISGRNIPKVIGPNLMLLTPLFNGSDMPTKIGRTFTGTREQFWLDALPAGVEPRLAGHKSFALTISHGCSQGYLSPF